MIVFLIVVVLFLYFIHILFNYNKNARMLRKIPGPKEHFIIGNAWEILVSPVEIMNLGRRYASAWKGIYRFWAYPMGAINIYNPEDIEIILSSTKFNEKSMIYNFLKPWLGNGLLVSSGAKWQQRRKILTPAFHFNILRQFLVIMEENSQRLVKELQSITRQPVDVLPVLSEFTLNTICETAMGSQLNAIDTKAGKSYKEALYKLFHFFFYRFTRIHLYSDFLFSLTRQGKVHDQCVDIVHSFSQKVITDRCKYLEKNGFNFNIEESEDEDFYSFNKRKKTAMLDLLISAEKDGIIDNAGIQEEVDTFMFEGHDTTASGLTFCFMLLANHKHVQDKIFAELDEIFGDSKRPAKMSDLSKMKYLECCIKESLRLYPPVHFISRNITEPVKLSGYEVPVGSYCHIQIYDLHRREDLFKNAAMFDPDRFLPENCLGRHSYSYIPFSAGPRNCIGQRFAIMEMKSAISAVLREFVLEPVTRPSDIQLIADMVLRSSEPILVNFIKRQ